MTVGLFERARRYVTSGHARSVNVKKNILLTFAFKVPSILVDLFVLRLTLSYLEPVKFGIWITLASIIAWMSFSDVGMGSGLRNRLAEALARGETDRARRYVSTTYAMMLTISASLVAIFAVANGFIQWDWALNAPPEMAAELSRLAFWVVFFTAIFYAANIIKSILKATQTAAMAAAIDLAASLMILAMVWVLLETTSNSIFLLGFWHSLLLAAAPLIATFLFFGLYRPELSPSARHVDIGSISDIWGLGLKFFVIQICSVVIFSTDYLIIAQTLGPEEVTGYAVVFKYFHVLTVGFAMIAVPFWSAFTDAYTRGEMDWIKRILGKQMALLLPLTAAALFMALTGRYVIQEVWLDRDLGIELLLLGLMGFYVVLQGWNRVFSFFLNGVGKLNLTLYTMLAGAIINIPVSIHLARDVGLGPAGVILGTIISLSIFAALGPIRTLSVLSEKR